MILQKYVIREWVVNFLITTSVLLGIVLLIVPFFQFQKFMALDDEFIFKVLPYFVPVSLVYIVPFSVLLSSLFVFGRLSEDNELVAMKCGGVSLLRITRPLLYLTFGISIAIVITNTHLVPYCHFKTRQLTVSAFKNRVFSATMAQGADEIKLPEGKIAYQGFNKGVFNSVRLLKFSRESDELMEELCAREGHIAVDEENAQLSLDLTNVYITRWKRDKEGQISPALLKSDRFLYRFDISALFTPSRRNLASMTDRQLDKLLREYKDNRPKENQILLHKYQRLSSGVTPLIFAMIGIPFGVLIRKGGKLAGVLISTLIIFVGYYPLTMLSTLMGTKEILPASLSVWLGNIILFLLAITLFYYIIKYDK
ncbi:MAG: LptF/LptG family permease [Planctomycetota bacterium]|nr:LptF/LptG family permease [Planctomycetota bacterium]MDI6787954.1 LptF/LptG family permease [Planctomycetota bacterium]